VEVLADRDADVLDRRLAGRLRTLIAGNPQFDGAAEFLAWHSWPPLRSADEVGR
jgi:hypothetical protein